MWVENTNYPSNPLNGLYYSAPAANIKSLTIRGSDDKETIIIEGPLGLSSAGDKSITIVGRDGDDTIRINRIDGPGAEEYHGTIKVDGGTGTNKLYVDDSQSATNNTYTITAASVTRAGRAPIEYVAISTLGLTAGSGSDVVNLDGVAGTLKLELAGGPGRDKLAMIAGHANDPTLTGFEDLVISGGKLTLNTSALGVETMTQSGGTLEGTADVSASVSLAWSGGTMQGTGKTVSLNTSAMTLSGTTTLTRTLENHGTGTMNAPTIGGGTGTLRNTGYLSGTGTLAGKLVNGGSLLPGGAGVVGTITVQGAFESAGTLATDLGATADLVAAQTVTLGGTFSPTAVAGFPAKSYTVISNTGQNPVNGTFALLPEGTIVTVNGVRYTITYVGNDGNDVVLHGVAKVNARVWDDKNLDGVYFGEPGLPNVPVQLYKVSAAYPNGQLVAATMTDAGGDYLFDDLARGDYFVVSGKPDPTDWWKYTRKDFGQTGPDDIDNDSDADRETDPNPGRTHTFTLDPAEVETRVDVGLYKLGTVGDVVWRDYYIGADGIQNDNTGGFADLSVTLVSTPSGYGGATTTGAYGDYLFEKVELVDANWVPISYRVQFTKPPDSGGWTYAFAPPYQGGDDALDSDADPATGLTGPFTLSQSGAVNRTIDCGIQTNPFSGGGSFASSDLGSGEGYPDGISGRMWVDEDRDGVRDPDEHPVPGWVVGLYDAGGRLVAETWTDWDGKYQFTGVAGGQYRVRFDPPVGGVGFTRRDRGGDDTRDSDADPDGYTALFTYAESGPGVASVDAGLVRPGGRVRGAPAPSAAGTLAPPGAGIDPFGLWGDDREDDPAAVGAVNVG